MARIVQFGTSRFLQAHVDLFVHQARASGQDVGPITVVKTTEGAERSGRVVAFRNPAGFPVCIRGYLDGEVIDETVQVTSVDSAFATASDWPEIARLFAEDDVAAVVTNVGERGYEVATADQHMPTRSPAISFPAKLLQLLHVRHQTGGGPPLILPCELVPSNGAALRRQLVSLSLRWNLSPAFAEWFTEGVVFADTLVDRIVSAPLEPLGAIAEPYALWAIRHAEPPLRHAAILSVPDLEPFERLKLHVLNLGHTVLADLWLNRGGLAGETVKQLLSRDDVRRELLSIYEDEVMPGFAARGMVEDAKRYVGNTVPRFDNPFLEHHLSDIAQNHVIKVQRRIADFIAWAKGADSGLEMPRLAAIASATR